MSTEISTIEKTQTKVKEPSKWKVLLLNDDFTPMDFVVTLLIEVFKHDTNTATSVMLQVHETGAGIAGVYDFEIAEIKAVESTKLSRENGFPLQIKIEQE